MILVHEYIMKELFFTMHTSSASYTVEKKYIKQHKQGHATFPFFTPNPHLDAAMP